MTDGATKTNVYASKRRQQAESGARLKLRAGQYVRRLREIADKAESVEPSMVPALRLKADIYKSLLAKCLPDLKSIEHSGEVLQRHVQEFSDAELAALAAGSRAGTAEQTDSSPQPSSIQ